MKFKSIRVLIVNDSATMRAALKLVFAEARDIQIVGELADAARVVEEVEALGVDVVLMDVVMPGIDGYEATRRIMARRPTPIVMVTSVMNPRDVNVALDALRSGALSVVSSPPGMADAGYAESCAALLKLVRLVASLRLSPRPLGPGSLPPRPPVPLATGVGAIGIVASTGGPAALVELLGALPVARCPPILVVQHITRGFAAGLAEWLATTAKCPVSIAKGGEVAVPGHVYVPPEDAHLGLAPGGRLLVSDAPPVGLFRPSGTFLLRSFADTLASRGLGVILTGMGSDGAEGALALRRAGGVVVGQDEGSSVVFGMANIANTIGALEQLVSLEALPAWLTQRLGIHADSDR